MEEYNFSSIILIVGKLQDADNKIKTTNFTILDAKTIVDYNISGRIRLTYKGLQYRRLRSHAVQRKTWFDVSEIA